MKRLFLVFGLAWALWLVAFVGASAQMETGRAIAERWCANCHGALPGRAATATDGAPPFSHLAGLGADSIRGVLIAPHERMRGIDLTTRQIDLVVDYIDSLGAAE